MRGKDARSSLGSTTTGLLFALVLLVGAGGFNYYRNYAKEARMPRPYRSYSDTQLAALIAAYQQEVKGLDREAPSGRLAAGPSGQLLGERVSAYDRIQRAGDARRRQMADAAGQQSILAKLEREQKIRKELGKGLARHLHRLLTL